MGPANGRPICPKSLTPLLVVRHARARIWKDRPTSAEVVYRFLEFDGIDPKIASMAVNILARDFKIRFADYYAIDISADVHVRRVFGRLGLCPPDAKIEQIIYKAGALYPKFPGIMDLACWEIGRNWCRRGKPACGGCYMNSVRSGANPDLIVSFPARRTRPSGASRPPG